MRYQENKDLRKARERARKDVGGGAGSGCRRVKYGARQTSLREGALGRGKVVFSTSFVASGSSLLRDTKF